LAHKHIMPGWGHLHIHSSGCSIKRAAVTFHLTTMSLNCASHQQAHTPPLTHRRTQLTV
jgi:hypothetical protein